MDVDLVNILRIIGICLAIFVNTYKAFQIIHSEIKNHSKANSGDQKK